MISFQDPGKRAPLSTSTALALREPVPSAAPTSAPNLHSAGGGRRPVKVWNAARTVRKALVVATYEEFQRKGREKIGLSQSEPVLI